VDFALFCCHRLRGLRGFCAFFVATDYVDYVDFTLFCCHRLRGLRLFCAFLLPQITWITLILRFFVATDYVDYVDFALFCCHRLRGLRLFCVQNNPQSQHFQHIHNIRINRFAILQKGLRRSPNGGFNVFFGL
jgi:hypothetical protein